MRSSKGSWIAGVVAVCGLLVVLVLVLRVIRFQNTTERELGSEISRDALWERLRATLSAVSTRPVPPELVDQALRAIRLQRGGKAPSRQLQAALAEGAARPFPREALDHVLRFGTLEAMQEAMLRSKDAPPTKVETKVTRIPIP